MIIIIIRRRRKEEEEGGRARRRVRPGLVSLARGSFPWRIAAGISLALGAEFACLRFVARATLGIVGASRWRSIYSHLVAVPRGQPGSFDNADVQSSTHVHKAVSTLSEMVVESAAFDRVDVGRWGKLRSMQHGGACKHIGGGLFKGTLPAGPVA